MRIVDMTWMQVEDYLQRDNRAVVPLGSTEQHAYLSLGVDSILSEKVSVEAAEPIGVPVFPAVAYGITPYFRSFPGTISMRVSTYLGIIRDILDGLAGSGFRRVVLVNGHGGNSAAEALAIEWMADHPHVQVKFHNWWNAPRTWAKVVETDAMGSHASWMENFPWTRLPNVVPPSEQKLVPDRTGMARPVGERMREVIGDGNFGGFYQRPDDEMLAIWEVAVAETRSLIEEGWD